VIAPICEEILFRGFIFAALRNWRGTLPAAIITGLLFGGVHVGSAPALDLVPLAALGFGLCLLYRRTGSLYPCFAAHSLNNSLAFSSLENWNVASALLLMVGALAGIGGVVLLGKRVGLIAPRTSLVGPGA
jgi:membrane protease YdiL (CAAX protease family)